MPPQQEAGRSPTTVRARSEPISRSRRLSCRTRHRVRRRFGAACWKRQNTMRSPSPSKLTSVVHVGVPPPHWPCWRLRAVAASSAPFASMRSASTTGSGARGGALVIETHSDPEGTYLTDGASRTPGTRPPQRRPRIRVAGGHQRRTPVTGSGVIGSDLGQSKRTDGTEQVNLRRPPAVLLHW
jgi:hypothetical protein